MMLLGVILTVVFAETMAQNTFSMNMNVPLPTPNCSVSDHNEVLRPCVDYVQQVVGAADHQTIEQNITSNLRAIQNSLVAGNLQNVGTQMGQMCTMKFNYDQCANTALQQCPSPSLRTSVDAIRTGNAIYGYLTKSCDGQNVKSEILSEIQSAANNIGTCLATTQGMALKAAIERLRTRLTRELSRVQVQDFQVTTKSQDKVKFYRLQSLCKKFRGGINYIKFLFRRYHAANCNQATKRLLTDQILMNEKGGLGRYCPIPKIREQGFDNKANRRDMKRVTVGLFGSSHMRVFNQTDDWITCQEDSNGDQVDFINHDHLKISGVLARIRTGQASGATYLKSMKIKFRASNFDDLESLTLPAGNTNPFPNKMDGNRDEVPAGSSGAAGGKTIGRIKMTWVQDKYLYIVDQNSGCFLYVRKFYVNNTIPFYSFIARLPESLLSDGSGLLVDGCTENVDAATANANAGRRRRATQSDAQTFDARESGDPSATQMGANANNDLTAATAFDAFLSGGLINAKITNTLLCIALLCTVAKLLIG